MYLIEISFRRLNLCSVSYMTEARFTTLLSIGATEHLQFSRFVEDNIVLNSTTGTVQVTNALGKIKEGQMAG